MVGSPPMVFPSEGSMVIPKFFYYHGTVFNFLVKMRMVIGLLYFLKKISIDLQNDYENGNVSFLMIFLNYHKFKKIA
jgi:hypothetical protein